MGFEKFIQAMLEEYERHVPEKGHSWKTCDYNYLEEKLNEVYLKWSMTGDTDELVDMGNMCAMIYVRNVGDK